MPHVASAFARVPKRAAVNLMALNDFEFGAAGDLVTAANLNSTEQGTAWTWSLSRTPVGHTRIAAGGSNFALPATISGAAIVTNGTRRVVFDLTEAVSDNQTPIYEHLDVTPPAGDFFRVVATGFLTLAATASTFCSMDLVWLTGSPYVTLQLNIHGAGTEGTGGELHIETQTGGGTTYKSSSVPVVLNTTYHYELLWDGTTGHMALIIRSADMSTLIGTSGKISTDVTGGELTAARLSSYLNPQGGTVSHDKFARVWGRTADDVPFPLFPLTVPIARAITLVQSATSELTLEWDSMGLAFTLERSANAGGSWTALYTNEESLTLAYLVAGHFRYVDTSVVDGQTYRYRLTAIIGQAYSSAVQSADVLVDNGAGTLATDTFDAYTDASALGDAGSSSFWATVNDFCAIYKPASDGGFFGGTQACARYVGASFTANHRSEVTCRTLTPGSFHFIGAAVRCQSGADTRYWFQTDGTNWFLVVRMSGSQTVLNSGTHSVTSGAKIAIEATGVGSATRLTAQVDTGSGWVNVSGCVNVDPGSAKYIDGGAPGVQSDQGSGSGVLGDDWRGTDI